MRYLTVECRLMHAKEKIYECRGCGQTTVICKKKCDSGMAREFGLKKGKCLKVKTFYIGLQFSLLHPQCSKLISNWDSPEENRKAMQKKGWCSWCLEKSTHTLTDKNKIKRNEYACDICSKPTMCCIARGRLGVNVANTEWNPPSRVP